MCLDDSTPSRSLLAREADVPTAGAGEVLIRVHAAGVTPTEVTWYPTTHTKGGEVRVNAVPGHEFSGVVVAVGSDVIEFREGDEIYGMNDWFADGAMAEYCLTVPASIARKPTRLSHTEAAAVPIGALTAWQGLFDRAKLQGGERVLIHGGAGAVGVFAIQLARQAGAFVITTASARHREFLTQLGADQVIDYKTERFEEQLRDLDVVFDGVGGATLRRSWGVLKDSGRLVTIAADGEVASDERTKAAFFIVEPNRQQLTEIAALFDRGELLAFVDAVVPLEQASAAYFGGVERRQGLGKVVVSVRA
ncbi:MAG: NADP-dependent oxidoreductase [Chthoniobacteraceae bacterium]